MLDTIQKPMPDFSGEASQGGKSVGERQRDWKARNAPPGTVPIVLTQALARETELKAQLAETEAEFQRGIFLTDQWNALLHRRDLLAAQVNQGRAAEPGMPRSQPRVPRRGQEPDRATVEKSALFSRHLPTDFM